MRKVYKYYTGQTVFTLDGENWFMNDDDKGTIKPIRRPLPSKIALDITNVGNKKIIV